MLFTFQPYCNKLITHKKNYFHIPWQHRCLVDAKNLSDQSGQALELIPNKISINFDNFAKKFLVIDSSGHLYMGSEQN